MWQSLPEALSKICDYVDVIYFHVYSSDIKALIVIQDGHVHAAVWVDRENTYYGCIYGKQYFVNILNLFLTGNI